MHATIFTQATNEFQKSRKNVIVLKMRKKSTLVKFQVFGVFFFFEVSKGAKIGNRYNQVPHLAQDTNGKVIVRHHRREPRGQPFPSR